MLIFAGLGLTRIFIVIIARLIFIYLLKTMCGSFMLGRLFDLIFAHSWLNGALYCSLKNISCGKSSLNYFLTNVTEMPISPLRVVAFRDERRILFQGEGQT